MRAMHKNTNNYQAPVSGPSNLQREAETGIGLTFLDDASPVAAGFPVSVVAPCKRHRLSGRLHEPGQNARNADAARKF